MIRALRSNCPANRPEVARWVHPRFPQDGAITLQLPREDANRSSTTDESRVQPFHDESRVGEVAARDALGFPLATKALQVPT